MARADTDMWVPRTVLVGFLKLNHPYNHGVSLLDHKVCCSVTKSCSTLFTLMDCSIPGFPVLHYLPRLLRLMSIESVMPSNRLILCHPLLLLPSVFPSIRGFPNELTVCIRSNYLSFSFSPSEDILYGRNFKYTTLRSMKI